MLFYRARSASGIRNAPSKAGGEMPNKENLQKQFSNINILGRKI